MSEAGQADSRRTVVVLCANAGVDRTYEVENFAIGGFHHPKRFRVIAGGKGINVARALRTLGVPCVATGFLGGSVRSFVERQLASSGISPAFVPIAEESRVCINIIDPVARKETRVDEVGPLVSPSEVDLLRSRWRRLLSRARLAIISGSAPRGVPFDLYAELIEVAHRRGVPVFLDARDEWLRRALPACPTLLKPNSQELALALELQSLDEAAVLAAAEKLIAQGIGTVVVTFGRRGAAALDRSGLRLWAKPPDVETISPVGSGDAMLAGIAAAFVRGLPLEEQMRWGTAAAAANAATFGACLFDAAKFRELLGKVEVQPLSPPEQSQ